MTLYSRGNARRSLVDTVGFRAISQISTVLGYIVLVRGMSEADFGVYSLLYAFIPVVSTVASLGLEQVLRRYQPEYLRAGNRAAAQWLMRLVASTRFLTNLVVLGVILLTWNHVAPIFKLGAHRAEFASFSLLILLYFQSSILQLTLGSYMMHRYSVGSTTILSIVKLVSYAVLYRFHALSLEAAIYVDTLAYAVAYVVMRVAYRRQCVTAEGTSSYKPEPAERKRLLKYALFNNFNDAGVLLMYSTLDNFFIAAFVSTTAVGVYAFYTRLSLMAHSVLPVRLFDNVIQPMFFSIPVAESRQKLPLYFTFLLNMNLLIEWPVLAFSLVYHAEIVHTIFGGKFINYSWLLPMVMAFAVINTLSEPTNLVAQYAEKTGVILMSKLFSVYNVAAMAVLVPFMGVYGAALAAGTAQTMKNAFVWWHVRDRAVWTNLREALPVSLLLWSGCVASCFVVKRLLVAPAMIHLIIGGIMVALVSLVHVRSAALSSTDRALLASIAPHKIAPVLVRLGLLRRDGNWSNVK